MLRRINLDIAEGDFITIMGPSGAGKSTLMGIVRMLDGAWKANITFSKIPSISSTIAAASNCTNIGFVFQQYHLLDNHVAENRPAALLSRHQASAKEWWRYS